jgi:prepilin-type N-terminal cleavage/methylation domain-containing protein
VAKRGFTLLELVIVIGIVALLVAFAIERLLALRVEAERATLQQVVGGLRAAVATKALSLITSGRDSELARLQGSNPMDDLLETPLGYLGEYDAPEPVEIPPGSWYFDRGHRLLVYRVRYGARFSSPLGDPARARFRVVVSYDDRDGSGTFDPDTDGFGGARLAAEEPYEWLDETVRGAR